jgi:hypothetical protein
VGGGVVDMDVGVGVWRGSLEFAMDGRTDSEEEEGEQRDGVAAEAPAERAGGRRLLCGLHGGWA